MVRRARQRSTRGAAGDAALAPPWSPPHLLAREPAEAVRLVAQALLAGAEAAAARLSDPEDADALHAFRVALRRLRSWLRAFRPEISDTIGRKLRRRLREAMASTGEGRDAEVFAALLAAERKALPPAHRRAVDALARQLSAATSDPRARAAAALGAVAPALAEALARYHRQVGQAPRQRAKMRPGQDRFGDAAAAAVRGQAAALSGALAAVGGPDDVERAHRGRIETKRLRYLLEPLRDVVPAVARPVGALKALQDLVGELHDVHALSAQVAEALAAAAAESALAQHAALLAEGEDAARGAARRSALPGLFALDRRLRLRRDTLYGALTADWLGDRRRTTELLAEVEAVAKKMEGRGRRGR